MDLPRFPGVSSRFRRAAVCVVAALAVAAPAIAAQASDTMITVSPREQLAARAVSPVDFPGISVVRKGEPLPRGWVVVRRDVRIKRGAEVASGAFRMTCPKDKKWASGTASDDILASVLDRSPRKRSVLVLATFPASEVKVGETAAGTVYALPLAASAHPPSAAGPRPAPRRRDRSARTR